MRNLWAFLLILVIALTTTACTREEPPTQAAVPALRVSGGSLVDEADQPIALRGLSSHGLGWYPAISMAHL